MSCENSLPLGAQAPCSPERFSVHFLSSGSRGNCTLVEAGDERFLIDFGLTPQLFIATLAAHGVVLDYSRRRGEVLMRRRANPCTPPLSAVVVTHTHSDHMNDRTLRVLRENGVRVIVHEEHAAELATNRDFREMTDEGLASTYHTNDFSVTRDTRATPLAVSHDAVATHGFVFRHRAEGTPVGQRVKFSYLADLGFFRPEMADHVRDSDIIALEFNHDLEMERNSPRPRTLVNRVLGNFGHLSNEQAAQALRHVLGQSRRMPRFLAALHLSSDCNRPELAEASAREVLNEASPETQLIVTRQRIYAGSASLAAHPARVGEFGIEPKARPRRFARPGIQQVLELEF
ncbi:hypothetical protein CVU37_10175 [candidate division BRC1 bacterium HGW-BRC1-1]|nr:MAG: hypothetical protein CVU37_10175 [candidate division BRC1 bacterium HGW-BRC1-1]